MIKTLFIRNITEEEGEAIEWLQQHYKVGRAGTACRKAVRDVKRLEEENLRLARKYTDLQYKFNKIRNLMENMDRIMNENDT